MTKNMTDSETIIRQAPPGTMMFARVIFDPEHGWETALFVREEPKYVNGLGDNPVVELRAGVLIESNVALVALMMKAGGELYETWFNYRSSRSSFLDMSKQTRIVIAFYLPAKKRQIVISNNLRRLFERATQEAEKLPNWTMADFDAARELVYSLYPDVQSLWNWNSLGEIPSVHSLYPDVQSLWNWNALGEIPSNDLL